VLTNFLSKSRLEAPHENLANGGALDKQKAVSLLNDVARDRFLGPYGGDLSHGYASIVLFEKDGFPRKGNPTEVLQYQYRPPYIFEAVEFVTQNAERQLDSGFSKKTGFVTYFYILDGDLEIFVTYPVGPEGGHDFYSGLVSAQKVELKRRAPRLAGYEKFIHLALKIRKEHRSILPASAGIIVQEGDYVIVAPADSFRIQNYSNCDNLRKKVIELQEYFRSQWVRDTVLVHRVPAQQPPRTCRSKKTSYFSIVLAANSVGGYAESVLIIRAQVCDTDDAKTFLKVACNPDRILRPGDHEDEFFVKGHETLKMLGLATSSLGNLNAELTSRHVS